jgi:hypothetical protein
MFKYIKDLPHDFTGYKYAAAMAELQAKYEEKTGLEPGVMIRVGDSLGDYVVATDGYAAMIVAQRAIQAGGTQHPIGARIFDWMTAFGYHPPHIGTTIEVIDLISILGYIPTVDLFGKEFPRAFVLIGDYFFYAQTLATLVDIAQKIGTTTIVLQGVLSKNESHYKLEKNIAFFKLDESTKVIMNAEKSCNECEHYGEL